MWNCCCPMLIHMLLVPVMMYGSRVNPMPVTQKSVAVIWLGIMVPAGTPRAIIEKLNAGVVAAMASPEVHEKIAGFGVRIVTGTPGEFDALMREEYEKYARLVKLSGAKLD